MPWITTKQGKHINTDWFDEDEKRKEKQIAENEKQADIRNRPDVVSAIHYTDESNIQSLLENEFDMSRAGEGAGSTWGAGAYYLDKGSYEDDMYSVRLNTNSYIQSDIDTSDFLKINLGEDSYKGIGKMYDAAAQAFSTSILKEYRKLAKQYKMEGDHPEFAKRKAFIEVAKFYYKGLVIHHRVHKDGGEYIDPLSGGNQIVVYDQSKILSKKKG